MRSPAFFDPQLFQELDRVQRTFESLFGRNQLMDGRHGLSWNALQHHPAFSVVEHNDRFVITGDLPGWTAENLNISFKQDQLTLKGTAPQAPQEGFKGVHQERRSRSFERRFQFATPIQHDGLEATLKDGVLRLTLPKSQDNAPRLIKVSG